MANFTAREQLMLELINRARMDPKAEAARYGIELNEGPPSTTISSTPKQVLAGNDHLGKSADKHSDWMIANSTFDHYEQSGTGIYAYSPSDRAIKAGYGTTFVGENIAYTASSASIDLTQSIDQLHELLFVDSGVLGRGHRLNILREDYKELGVGHEGGGPYRGSNNASIVTQDFGARSGTNFITGVVYNDTTTNDDFFTVGEETANRKVSGSGASDKTGAGGGYELEFTTNGNKTITFDLAAADLKVTVALGDTNVKVDAVNGKEIWTNASSLTSKSNAIKELHALGISKVDLTGSDASEKIYGNAAANALSGKDGKDTISGGGGKDTITGGGGKDSMSGGSGADKFIFKAVGDSKADKPDTITDFGKSGADKIDLSALGDLTYRDEHKINGANQVNVTKDGGDVIVHINLDANMDDEMRIVLHDTSLGSMGSGDFIL